MLFWQLKHTECEMLFFIFTVLVIFLELRVECYECGKWNLNSQFKSIF